MTLEPIELNCRGFESHIDLSRLAPLVHCQHNDFVVLAGTIVEGIGNPHSDFDIYVICNSRPIYQPGMSVTSWFEGESGMQPAPGEPIYAIHDYYNDIGTHIDVQYWTYDEVARLIAKIDSLYGKALVDPSAQVRAFSGPESDLIHRLLSGKPLARMEQYEQWRSNLPRDRYCYLAYRAQASLFWDFKDILGAWSVADWELASELAREFLIAQAQGLTHLYLNTNAKRKWLFKYMDRVLPASEGLADECRRLAFRGRESPIIQRDYTLACLQTVDRVFAAVRHRLDTYVAFPSSEFSYASVLREFEGNPHPHPQVEVEKAYRLNIYRQDAAPSASFLSPLA